MTVKTAVIFFTAMFAVAWFSCSNNRVNQTGSTNTKNDTGNCTTTTIIDPNNPKPMALNMRAMALQAENMKKLLAEGKMVDSVSFPFIKFYLSEPTDPGVLEPLFFENASLYEKAYYRLMRSKENQAEHYNAMIGACINCHQSYCSGPLKRIRKLPL